VILADENYKLQSENEQQKKKRVARKQYIATGGVLTVEEGIRQVQERQQPVEPAQAENIESREGIATLSKQLQTRAPRTCSICRSLAHTARTCPEHI
jgi:hypothetical protein